MTSQVATRDGAANRLAVFTFVAVLASAAVSCGSEPVASVPLDRSTLPEVSTESLDNTELPIGDTVNDGGGPTPEEVADMLDDPSMVEVGKTLSTAGDSDPQAEIAHQASKWIPDLDANVGGAYFLGEPLGAVVVGPDLTYVVATGMIRDDEGLPEVAGVYIQTIFAGTTTVSEVSTLRVDRCGKSDAVLEQNAATPSHTLEISCDSAASVRLDLTGATPVLR